MPSGWKKMKASLVTLARPSSMAAPRPLFLPKDLHPEAFQGSNGAVSGVAVDGQNLVERL